MLKIYSEMSVEQFNAWSGGRDTLEAVREAGLIDELDALLEMMFCGDDRFVSDVQLNDFLWFESDYIFETLGMNEDDEEEEEEDEEEE